MGVKKSSGLSKRENRMIGKVYKLCYFGRHEAVVYHSDHFIAETITT